ncbi:MAG: hypothetical protein F6K50_12810 [Moorea sp. SIO3I7]|uniref:hypothetical protein n=1 Tax=unclassified Moorena TaxID=2683338 RepID=UPI0013BFB0B5|nr:MULTISPECIES: hypothetical protein [unclassified Moorena]NEN96380.1 hypothetical protein [Moorena sp. SIO3I7]NEO07287.1 hypothetical protein [Moorena sp. SIO3I8]NEO19747.1 hypothetical protein [Moorena sp. SIO4A5]NEP25337.1 hypothetical protein [Moorena sp. SIO3I6]NEQ58778.1 hypothetical protein [Moorena sp. SIO4A1]
MGRWGDGEIGRWGDGQIFWCFDQSPLVFILMRYKAFFPDSRFPIPDSRFPIPCSLLSP